jgi:hypothetical protein
LKALRLWLVLASAHLVGRLVVDFTFSVRTGLSPRGWAQALVIPVAQTAALSVLFFLAARRTRRRS